MPPKKGFASISLASYLVKITRKLKFRVKTTKEIYLMKEARFRMSGIVWIITPPSNCAQKGFIKGLEFLLESPRYLSLLLPAVCVGFRDWKKSSTRSLQA